MTLTKAIREFLDDVRLGKSPLTLRSYESDLSQLVAYVRPNSVLAFTAEAVQEYLLAASKGGNRMATLARKRATLNSFGKWGVVRSLWLRNPVEAAAKIPFPKSLPRPFTAAEVDRLFELARTLPPDERLLLALLFYTGLRIAPLCGIRIGDISDDPPAIRVVSKGNRPAVKRLVPELDALLRAYILEHTGLDPAEPLLKNSRGGTIRPQQAQKITRRWGQALGIPRCTPHRFRHTFATGLLRAGVDIRLIQKVLDHAVLQSTQVYTEVLPEDEAAAVRRLPWRL